MHDVLAIKLSDDLLYIALNQSITAYNLKFGVQ